MPSSNASKQGTWEPGDSPSKQNLTLREHRSGIKHLLAIPARKCREEWILTS